MKKKKSGNVFQRNSRLAVKLAGVMQVREGTRVPVVIYDRRDLLLHLSPVHCCGDQSPAEKTSPPRQRQALTFAAEYVKTSLVGKLSSVRGTLRSQL